MKDVVKKPKPTLESLMGSSLVITGKRFIERSKAAEKEAQIQKAIMDEAIEFERRNKRRNK